MAYNGIISPPVLNNPSGGDIQAALGESSGAVDVLCKSNNINKWARYKPVRHSKKTPITLSERNSVDWGLSVPFFTSEINEAVYNIMQTPSYAEAGWGYLKPNGGNNAPYRQSDFVKTPNDPSGTPWVGNVQGYNHQAKFPMKVEIDTVGVFRNNYGVYEVNKQVVSELTFYFTPALGDDLCIQDFLRWNLVSSTIKWRPFFYLYYGDNWYKSTTQPTRYGAGTEITYTRTTVLTLTVSLANLAIDSTYHLCIGIGCCDDSASRWPTSNECKFIAPFVNAQDTPQFYYKFTVRNYSTREIIATDVWCSTGNGPKQATGSYQRFVITGDAYDGGWLAITIQVQRTNYTARFIALNGSATRPYYMRAVRQISGNSATQDMTPTDANHQFNNVSYWEIPVNTSSDWATNRLYTNVYAKLPQIPRNTTAVFHVQTRENSTSDNDWVEAGSFEITWNY